MGRQRADAGTSPSAVAVDTFPSTMRPTNSGIDKVADRAWRFGEAIAASEGDVSELALDVCASGEN